MSIITVGIDLAKNVFAVHGVDDNGKPLPVARRGRAEPDSAEGRIPSAGAGGSCFAETASIRTRTGMRRGRRRSASADYFGNMAPTAPRNPRSSAHRLRRRS